MHIEKWGNDEVSGIELGKCYVFPKLDGTNASLWVEDDYLQAGSRTRQLTFESDNANFFTEQNKNKKISNFFEKYPHLRLYGEWLVPHTLKTYKESAWNKFYVFDVYNDNTEQLLSYEEYQPLLIEFDLDYVGPIAIIKNGSYEHFIHQLDNNVMLIEDGKGVGEGIVIKNYDYYNTFGKQTWAKIITTEFKEKHYKKMGAPESEKTLIEEKICEEFVTSALVDKVYSKIHLEMDGWTSKYIPRLLETVYHDLITEEMWRILKDHKNPTINFTTLKHFCFGKVKKVKQELF